MILTLADILGNRPLLMRVYERVTPSVSEVRTMAVIREVGGGFVSAPFTRRMNVHRITLVDADTGDVLFALDEGIVKHLVDGDAIRAEARFSS